MNALQFLSSEIPVAPFEDDDVNPGILGRGLVDWLSQNLKDTRYNVTEVVPED